MSQKPAGETLGTVQRVVQIMLFFAERGESTLKELSTALVLAPSTCHRLLELLGREGLIEQDPVRRRYRIGGEFFRMSALVHAKHDIRVLALPFLREIVDTCNETCVLNLYLPSDGKMFFAEKVDSGQMLRYQLPMQTPVSVLWGASGRSIAAYLEADEIDRIHASEGAAPASGEKRPSRRTLDAELAIVRERGFAVTHGQKIAGAVGIAAPVFQANHKVVGSLGVTAPEARLTRKDEVRIGNLVRRTADKLSLALGANAPMWSNATAI
jgi:DNA-binding IclR family transcriptional regulator